MRPLLIILLFSLLMGCEAASETYDGLLGGKCATSKQTSIEAVEFCKRIIDYRKLSGKVYTIDTVAPEWYIIVGKGSDTQRAMVVTSGLFERKDDELNNKQKLRACTIITETGDRLLYGGDCTTLRKGLRIAYSITGGRFVYGMFTYVAYDLHTQIIILE